MSRRTASATETVPYQTVSCLTGEKSPLLPHLLNGLAHAIRIDILVAFLMKSGVELLVNSLQDAVTRGVPVRIVCGDYLGVTQPAANVCTLFRSSCEEKF